MSFCFSTFSPGFCTPQIQCLFSRNWTVSSFQKPWQSPKVSFQSLALCKNNLKCPLPGIPMFLPLAAHSMKSLPSKMRKDRNLCLNSGLFRTWTKNSFASLDLDGEETWEKNGQPPYPTSPNAMACFGAYLVKDDIFSIVTVPPSSPSHENLDLNVKSSWFHRLCKIHTWLENKKTWWSQDCEMQLPF